MRSNTGWRPRTLDEGISAWRNDREAMERRGVIMRGVHAYVSEDVRNETIGMDEAVRTLVGSQYGIGHNGGPSMGMDALPPLFTDPNSALPAIFTTMVDPDVFRILFTPNKIGAALGEQKRGTWLDDVILFPVVEPTGEVSSYGDYNNNGNAGVNTGFPARQNYLFQVIKEYGVRESERGSLAKINWVAEIDRAAAITIQKFFNFSYLFGIAGLYNYGIGNDPNLSAALTPGPKASPATGNTWILNGRINATANEIYADIEAMFYQLVLQTGGLIDQETEMLMLLSPGAAVALTATNSFNVNVNDLLEKNFPNIKIETIPQYAAKNSSTNPQGVKAGEFVQLMALELEGQKTAYAAYSEKMRTHPLIREMSSFKQKVSAGTWGTVLRMPASVVQMIGI
jgi:hypothetical protein